MEILNSRYRDYFKGLDCQQQSRLTLKLRAATILMQFSFQFSKTLFQTDFITTNIYEVQIDLRETAPYGMGHTGKRMKISTQVQPPS